DHVVLISMGRGPLCAFDPDAPPYFVMACPPPPLVVAAPPPGCLHSRALCPVRWQLLQVPANRGRPSCFLSDDDVTPPDDRDALAVWSRPCQRAPALD